MEASLSKHQQKAGTGVEKLARAGYATKGAVYCILGVISVQAAFSGGSATGSQGAVKTIGQQPFGQVLLVLTAVGLAGYALWQFVRAAIDPENKGSDKEGIAKRVGYAFSGLSHSALCVLAVQMVTGSSSGGSKRTYLGELMAQTGGQVAVGALGLFVIAAGVHQLIKAKTTEFKKELKFGQMSSEVRKLAITSGRIGLAARGVVFPIMGVYLIKAALSSDPSEAKGVGGALQEISSSTFGTTMLAVVAAGLVAYGVYQFVLAKYRRISV